MSPTAGFVVSGRVQGVGFRMFARRSARGLGLAGFAENRADGTVFTVVRGPAAAIRTYRESIESGPPWSEVDSVSTIEISDEAPLPKSFDMR